MLVVLVDLCVLISFQRSAPTQRRQGRPFDFSGTRFLNRVERQGSDVLFGLLPLRGGLARQPISERAMDRHADFLEMAHDVGCVI